MPFEGFFSLIQNKEMLVKRLGGESVLYLGDLSNYGFSFSSKSFIIFVLNFHFYLMLLK